jgi:pimeloyl-ACP methyl ester carboxylesterase
MERLVAGRERIYLDRSASTFGPMIGAVIRCVADNIEDAIIPDCGHWITEEQPAATTKLVVDFLHRRS